MFRTIGDQVPLWEPVLPPELLKLPVELSRVDELLDDEAFFAPIAGVFHPDPWPAVDADGGVPTADVPQVPARLGLRVVV